jgi:hypothetical protein
VPSQISTVPDLTIVLPNPWVIHRRQAARCSYTRPRPKRRAPLGYDQHCVRKGSDMNVREGMRRLGLTVGVLGSIAGGFVGYGQLLPLLTQRQQFKKFHALISSSIVTSEIESLRVALNDLPLPPPGYKLDSVAPRKPSAVRDSPKPDWPRFVPPPVSSWEGPAPNYDKIAALCGEVGGWKVNKGGIGSIHFHANPPCAKGTASEVEMIETEDGQEVYRTDPPGFWSYVLIALFPTAGFFVPWGVLRTVMWIVLGFVNHHSEKSSRV